MVKSSRNSYNVTEQQATKLHSGLVIPRDSHMYRVIAFGKGFCNVMLHLMTWSEVSQKVKR